MTRRPPQTRTTEDPDPDRTAEVYEARAGDWAHHRCPSSDTGARRAEAFGTRVRTDGRIGPVADLGCGPGWHARHLEGPPLDDGPGNADASDGKASDGNADASDGKASDGNADPSDGKASDGDASDGRPGDLDSGDLDSGKPHKVGARVVAVDRSAAMLGLVADNAPLALRVQADLRALPFARGALGGAWASRSYVHLARAEVPAALADLHGALEPGAPVEIVVFEGDAEHEPWPDDDFPGRRFSLWPTDLIDAVIVGAGFSVTVWDTEGSGRGAHHRIQAVRADTLPDHTGPGMRLLVVGLNPSVHSANARYGFAGPGNRFWPAALAAGLVSRPADPAHALRFHRLGMTDLVKRATPAADVLSPDEYRLGGARLERIVSWLQPRALCVVGLAGWRAAVDRQAQPGPQAMPFAGRPVHVLASTSGRNARWQLDDFVEHFRAAGELADEPPDIEPTDSEPAAPPLT